MPRLRVMSFNVRGAHYDDGVNSWARRLDLNLRTILKHDPDVIGFQELHLANFGVYLERLIGYAFYLGPPYNDAEPYQYPAIFWKEGRLRRVAEGGFWLSQTPEVHSRAWDTACIRSAAWVELDWVEAGLRFRHLNTHLDHVSELARREGARLILQRLEGDFAGEVPQLVTGDFNCPPGSQAHTLFLNAGFSDASWVLGRREPAWTFHNFQGRDYQAGAEDCDRIDWVLVRGWGGGAKVVDHQIIMDAESPLYPSDHYPIIAELVL